MSEPKLTPAGLSALMCARICHDLVSPVSALSTALEVLDDGDATDMHEDAMSLVRMSARQAAAKLQFLRMAFGAAGSAPGIIAVAELIKLVDGIYGEGKANIVWDAKVDGLDKAPARLLLNMVMLAVNAIPRGGEMVITPAETAEAVTLRIVATGPKARLSDAVSITLAGKAPEDGFDGRTIQPFYTGMMVREQRGKFSATIEGEAVTFAAVLPKA